MKLYGTPSSGNCHKVRLLLALLGRNWEEVPVDLAAKSHKSPAFLALNPLGKVPVLEDDGLVLYDSQAILVYLARRYGEDWFPADGPSAGKVMQWLIFAAHEIRQGPNMMRRINVAGLPGDLEAARAASMWVLDILEDRLGRHEWLALGRPTIADLAVYPYIALAPSSGCSLEGHSHVQAWLGRIKSLPGYPPLPGIDDQA